MAVCAVSAQAKSNNVPTIARDFIFIPPYLFPARHYSANRYPSRSIAGPRSMQQEARVHLSWKQVSRGNRFADHLQDQAKFGGGRSEQRGKKHRKTPGVGVEIAMWAHSCATGPNTATRGGMKPTSQQRNCLCLV
jgi:hypothetical protein